MKRAILCDFDGTITVSDVTNSLCQLHIPEVWSEVEAAWERGEISATQCYEREYAALALRQNDFDAYLRQVEISPGTVRLIELARRLGWEFHILSAGFDYYIETVLKRNGLSAPYTANGLSFAADGSPSIRFLDNDDPSCTRLTHPCAGCKPHIWRTWKQRGFRIIYIGDGSTDFCMAEAMHSDGGPDDIIFAKDRLLEYCQRRGIAAIPFSTLGDVAEHLPRLE